MAVQLKTNQTLTLKIKRLGINGEGIAYYKRLIIFVTGALPNETVVARISKATPRFAEADLVKIIKKSPDRIIPPCPVYEECGGCQLQHLAYNKQLDFKKDLLRQALEKYKPDGYQDFELRDTLGMENPWHYRNKAQFQLRKNKQTNQVEAGLYRADSHQLVPLKDCLVQEETTQKVINTVTNLLTKYDVPIYDERINAGILRTLMVRIGIETGEVQVVLITKTKKIPKVNPLIREITQRLPEVVSIMQNIQDKKTSVIMGDETIHLWGKEVINEKIDEVSFELSPRAFFQLNPQQTKVLYQEAINALDLSTPKTIVDAYCGVGTIGLSLAKRAKEVRGMDIISQAIDDAKKNAEAMNLTNTHYEVGTAESLLPKWLKEGFSPDAIVVDPPRTGLDDQLLKAIQASPSPQMVYISCNVSTLARDLVSLSKIYHVDYLQSVDMFPQTARCEVVVKLSKK
ncbi:23S rRNA (uracil(1939)-C(5))-methyltransferase RlmD [Enterococcus dongliensis]|uniref:23S rRNA (uracil(1939)-C(5))-methyltransferase RlmD n=1 Tax=Enterococcus dongliensis TaxID=2559925 RepID=UPI00288DEBCA|nr:23S rRNA (uracil(1939)-C(5))-methyltransferase RlmD [Enterococcus dongliensis]MDT2638902.1 23S rRNA (uracil(1939)-C(5))-methyltransferase RlmD [Enterococcus dongliensis]MDT2701988.1 23S rRNA (uracil(1939)-C(5))-methyltransferase RlmD [Enterococcus dongliensis]